MPTSIQIKGLYELNGFLRNLPINLRNGLNKESGQFMFDVQKSARLRAPKNTGKLRNSIIVKKEGNSKYILIVQSPYGVFQEEGFTPHVIPIQYLKQPSPGKFVKKATRFITVSKFTPFVAPALEHNLSKLSQRMNKVTKSAINKSGRRKK